MPKTLLLADDSVTIQKVVGITFANEDVELVTVDNGDDALTRARQVKPDLLLADIGMPGLNGYELCAAIRRDPNLAHIPVLLLTGTFETYDEQRAREVGASGHIAKPFEAQALVDRVFQLLAQAPPKAAPPKPAPAQTQAPRPAAPAAAPTQTPRPTPMPQAPAPTQAPRVAAPARPSAAPPGATPRPRPELPPVPHAQTAPAPRAAPPQPTAPLRVPAPAPKRESTPFEFELPPMPSAPSARPGASAPSPATAQEPVWEAEPEAEVLADDPALEGERGGLHSDASAETASPDATRLFAPDLLGRATRLPEVPEPPRAPDARKSDFSFGDLDFEEPTNPAANQSQIFGESSERGGDFEPEFAQPIPEAPLEVEALADPLYSQTTFLDPSSERDAPPSFALQSPVSAPPLPDLLAATPQPEAHAGSDDELELAEADTALDDEVNDSFDPRAQPFSPDTAAALETPRFERVPPARAAEAATRLMLPDEPETPVPTRAMPPASPRVSSAAAQADTLPPPARRAQHAPAPRGAASAIVDSTLLAQSVEKVAWEAFGTLSEQVVSEVLKRVEAVVWEVVPQLCERLIREEIARLKAEMSE
ncbi:MAG: response regulator [Myxococcota bacterium]